MHTMTAKLLNMGHPLNTTTDAQIYTGIANGLDAAFVINSATRKELIIFDPGCAPLMKPLLRSQELQPWYAASEGRWLIELPAGWTAATFGATMSEAAAWAELARRHSAIAGHLEPFAEAARQRPIHGDYWWELPADHHAAAYDPPKICWPTLSAQPRWVWDTSRCRLAADSTFIAPATPDLLGILASRTLWFVVAQTSQPTTETEQLPPSRLTPDFVAQLPIPPTSATEREAIGTLALRIVAQAHTRFELQQAGLRHILKNLAPPGAQSTLALQRWWELDRLSLRAELINEFDTDIPIRYQDDWEHWLTTQSQAYAEHTAQIAQLETDLDHQVARLFTLTSAEQEIIAEQLRADDEAV